MVIWPTYSDVHIIQKKNNKLYKHYTLFNTTHFDPDFYKSNIIIYIFKQCIDIICNNVDYLYAYLCYMNTVFINIYSLSMTTHIFLYGKHVACGINLLFLDCLPLLTPNFLSVISHNVFFHTICNCDKFEL